MKKKFGWDDITYKQFEEYANIEDPQEKILKLAENLTITEFNNVDWNFLKKSPKISLPKNEYVYRGKTIIPNIDIRKWDVKTYINFNNATTPNEKLNIIFGTIDEDYMEMSCTDVLNIFNFFRTEFIVSSKTISKFLKKTIKNKKIRNIPMKQLRLLQNLVFQFSSKQ